MNIKEKLRQQLLEGEINSVIQDLYQITRTDNGLHEKASLLHSTYNAYLSNKTKSTGSDELNAELNSIKVSAQSLIDLIPNKIEKHSRLWKWEKILLWLGIVAGITTITGYTIKDILSSRQTTSITKRPKPISKETNESQAIIPTKQTKVSETMNEIELKVKDNAKIGNIITGDSNQINIEQSF